MRSKLSCPLFYSLLVQTSFALAQGPPSLAAEPFTLTGIVTDESKAPIASAELLLGRNGESNRLFRTGTDGRFSFEGVVSGPVSLTARRLGYRVRTITLQINEATARDPLSVILQTIPGDVAPVYVEGVDSRLDAFYIHKHQNTFGRFIEQTEIERKGPVFVSELFRTVPGAVVKPSGRLGNIVRLRGCQPMIWIDGIHVQNAEIDDVVNPADIAGIEIYNAWSNLPSEYMDREGAGCGAIVVWTKSR